jgi:hypothetical protein
MERSSQSLVVNQFLPPDYRSHPISRETGRLLDTERVKVERGVIIPSYETFATSESLFTDDDSAVMLRSVRVSETVKAEFASNFAGSYVYLAVSNDYEAVLINPEDLSDRLTINCVRQQKNTWTAATPEQNFCLITGWQRDTLAPVSLSHQVMIRKGTTDNKFQFLYGMSWSSDYDVTTTGTNITVNGHTLTVYFKSTSLSDLGSTDYFIWQVTGATGGSFQRFTADEHNSMYFKRRSTSSDYFGDQLVFSWYNELFYYDPLGGICTVGYELTCGTQVKNFFNHLMVGVFSRGQDAAFLTNDSLLAYQVGCSDLNSIHDFYPEQNNEADVFLLRQEGLAPGVNGGVTAMCLYNDKLYVFTRYGCYEFTYIGLPLVMQMRPLSNNMSCGFINAAVETDYGIVSVTTRGDIVISDGVQAQPLDSGYQIPIVDFNVGTNSVGFIDTYASYREPLQVQLFYENARKRLTLRSIRSGTEIPEILHFDFLEPGWFKASYTNEVISGVMYQDMIPCILKDTYSVYLFQDKIYGEGDLKGKSAADAWPFTVLLNTEGNALFKLSVNTDDFDIKELNQVLVHVDDDDGASSSNLIATVTIEGYHGGKRLTTETHAVSVSYGEMPTIVTINNVRARGNWFKITWSMLGGVSEDLEFPQIEFRFLNLEQDVQA